ncbi:MAG: sensory rhodopsin transducer [Victivallaceae bacterium]|jgi:hypothetical protein
MTNQAEGHYTWVVPDGWLPPEGGEGDLINHESLMLLNTGGKSAIVEIDIYFADREPVKGLKLQVGAERINALRLDSPEELGYKLPRATQYALRVRSTEKIIVQYGRMDVRQANLAYYCTMAHPVDN